MNKYVEPYKEEWRTEFKSLKNYLHTVLGREDLDIQHVGSTAIPGALMGLTLKMSAYNLLSTLFVITRY